MYEEYPTPQLKANNSKQFSLALSRLSLETIKSNGQLKKWLLIDAKKIH